MSNSVENERGRGVRRRLLLTAAALGPFAAIPLAATPASAFPGDNYPEPWRSAALGAYVDDWGYASRYCTSWVAWALHNRNGFEMPRAIGHAANWGHWAPNNGYAVNMTPVVGSVAWWDDGGYGHVAWVEAVSGDQVTIQEYNYGYTGNYNRRIITRTSVSGYIHFKDIQNPTSTSTGDYNRDGVADIYAIHRFDSGSNSTSVHVLNGANPRQWLLQSGTILGPTNANWSFASGDYNRDGVADIYAINRRGTGTNSTELHVLNGANPKQFLLHSGTILGPTDSDWDFTVGDYNRDGIDDVYAINRHDDGSNSTSVHVINGANRQQWLLQGSTILGPTTTSWSFIAADYNRDGVADIYAINRHDSGSNSTSVHIVNGNNPKQWLLQTNSILGPTDSSWDF